MRNINFDNIQTKTDFKRMLFNFHNVVNKNKNYKIYKYENLDDQYKKSNLLKIINNFFIKTYLEIKILHPVIQ